MSRNRASNVIIEEIDTNRDGVIDRNELQNWVSNTEGLSSASYESRSTEYYVDDKITGRFGRNNRNVSSFGTITVDGQIVSDAIIQTNSLEETDRYLERAVDIYKDRNPQIIRRTATDGPVTYEQRIFVRYLQPPKLPPPGPLVIKEVRPPQPEPPHPLLIRQYSARPPTPPPLILRERPPTPPPQIASETTTRLLPALPAPPRSVVIERYPNLPEKPRDIIIERWIPYGLQEERRTIVEEAPPAVTYPEPHNKVIIYEGIDPRINRQFENGGITEENPAHYKARHGSSLLDSRTLLQLARDAGVYEDLTPPTPSSLTYTNRRTSNANYDLTRSVRDEQYTGGSTIRRGGMFFDFAQYGLLPSDYTPGMTLTRKFVRPTNFSFPTSSMWSTRVAKYKESAVDGRITSVSVQLLEDGFTIHSRTISESEYKRARVSSSASKLPWTDFIQVLKVFMLGNNQERESDIAKAFDILDQGRKGAFNRPISLADGLISPDELRAFLSILTDEYRVDLCVFLADTNGSGQISLSEFTRMVKSGLARDIICERT